MAFEIGSAFYKVDLMGRHLLLLSSIKNIRKALPWKERLAKDKHSGLLSPFLSYKENVENTTPEHRRSKALLYKQ